jgi:hypothetical protein
MLLLKLAHTNFNVTIPEHVLASINCPGVLG